MKIIKSFTHTYNKLSNFGKILVFCSILLLLIILFKYANANATNIISKEGFVQNDKFLFKKSYEVYDDFYAGIYDYLVFNIVKNEYEVGAIVNSTMPNETSVILDVGCGTGHHVSDISAKHLNVMGIDISPSMINKAKENYPGLNFKVGDVLNNHEFIHNSFTHILCMYFTVYYFKDKNIFFNNCMDWLMPGGYLVLHLVDREKFDPILPPGNPLYIVSPQKYAKDRITNTKITFNDFTYSANFDLNESDNKAIFSEKFKFNDGNVRKQEQILYMEDKDQIVNQVMECGFLLQGKVDLMKCAYEHQYLYIFVKPS